MDGPEWAQEDSIGYSLILRHRETIRPDADFHGLIA